MPQIEQRIGRLRADLADGSWHARNADLLAADSLDLGYRLVVSELAPS